MSPADLPLNEPLVFAPHFRPQVWGGRRLAEMLHKPLPAGVMVGESWELSAQPLHVSRVAEGPWASVSLQELWDDRREELWGTQPAPAQFPWLIKWLDCHDRFSVQVHPNDAAALRLLGEACGKTESWIVLHAEPTARIYAGLKAGVTPEELRQRSQDGSVAECLHSFVPQPGDVVHIPAGTVHAVGGGVLMAEVQQTSDATFRLFDWNRIDAQGQSRALHLDQALACIDFERGPVEPMAMHSHDTHQLQVDCEFYQLKRREIAVPETTAIEGMTVLIVLAGEMKLSSPDSSYERLFCCGETVLIPATMKQVLATPTAGETATCLHVTFRPST